MADLRLVPPPTTASGPARPVRASGNDLPPRWDDRAVLWDAWRRDPLTTAVFHLPLEQQACRRCGSLDQGWRTTGQVAVLPGITVEQMRGANAHGKGGKYGLRVLSLTRCQCGHDQVYELDTDELWDLDDTDYGDQGSVHPEQVQGQLW